MQNTEFMADGRGINKHKTHCGKTQFLDRMKLRGFFWFDPKLHFGEICTIIDVFRKLILGQKVVFWPSVRISKPGELKRL